MTFDTKIAALVREDLPAWQKLNVVAFTVSAIAAANADAMGEPYEDADGARYLPMMKQPVLVFGAGAAVIRQVYAKARERGVSFSIFTEELFSTPGDVENRAAVKAVKSEDLKLVGLAVRAEKKLVDKIFKGVALHR
jgi:hypothetical protein